MATGDRGGAVSSTKKLTPRQQAAVNALQRKARQRQENQRRYEITRRYANDPQLAHLKLMGPGGVKKGVYKAPKGVAGFSAKVIGDLADAAIHIPGGLYATGKAVGEDVAHANTRDRDFSFHGSRALAKALAKGTAEDFKHPLRHPGFTALDILALASAGAGTAARVGAAGKAARAGEFGTAAKALAKRPQAGTRVYREGDLEVRTPNSRNTLMRAGQKAHAKFVNSRTSEGRRARVIGKHLHQEERVVDAANRADAAALRSVGRKLTTPQETALRAVAEGQPIEKRITFHAHAIQNAKGVQEIADHRQKVALLTAAQRYVEDVKGVPHLKQRFERSFLTRASKLVGRGGAKAEELQSILERVEKVAGRREETLRKAGRLSEEQIASRKQGPGRVVAGARYEKPTPAKRGVPSQSLEGQRAHVARLEQLHERALTRADKKAKPYPPEPIKVAGGNETVTRAISAYEARSRLAELDKKYEDALNKIVPHVSPYSGTIEARHRTMSVKQWEQNQRNRLGGKGGKRGKRTTVTQEERRLAEDKLLALADKHPEQQFAKELQERRRLQEALNEHALEGNGHFGEITETVKTKPSTKLVPSDLPPTGRYTGTVERLGGALSVARDRLERMEKAAAKRRKPTGLVGAEGFSTGTTRIPYSATAIRPNVNFQGVFRGGEPKPPPSTTHEFTGGLLRKGNFRDRTTQLVAESGLEAERYASVLSRRDKILKAARDDKPAGDGWVPVRSAELKKLPPRVRELTDKADEGIKLSASERQELERAFDDWRQHVFPDEASLGPEEIRGVKWVRHELLDKLNQPRLLAPLGQSPTLRAAGTTLREVNAAAKGAMLYLAPKYAVPNLLGNMAMNLLQQGFAAPANLARATVFARHFGRDTWARIDVMMGEGFARAFAEDLRRGPASAPVNKLAAGWSKVVDVPSRRAAFLHEARKAGFKTPEGLQRLLTNEGERAKLTEVTQRAWEAIGDYSRMGAKEREIVRHVIFFYPWLKVSTRYSKHLLTEHPIESAALAQVGKQGEAQQHEDLGEVPSFAEEIFKVGERRYPGLGKLPVVRNPASANIFSSADLAKTGLNFLRGERKQSGYQFTGMLTPAMSALLTEITGRDPFTQAEVKGNPLKVFGDQAFGGLPQQLLKQRLERAGRDQSDKLYVYTSEQAYEQFGIGPLGKRGYNIELGNEIARKEDLGDVPPVKREYRTVFERRNRFYREMKRLNELDKGRMPKVLRDAFNVEAERQADYQRQLQAADKPKAGTTSYHLAKFKADVGLLAKYHQIDAAEARQMLTWASSQRDVEKLKNARRYISERYYQDADNGFLTLINDSKKYLEAKGAKGLD